MKTVSSNVYARVLFATIVLAAFYSPLAAQRRTASDSDWCADENWGRDRQGFCEVREYTVPAAGSTMTVTLS